MPIIGPIWPNRKPHMRFVVQPREREKEGAPCEAGESDLLCLWRVAWIFCDHWPENSMSTLCHQEIECPLLVIVLTLCHCLPHQVILIREAQRRQRLCIALPFRECSMLPLQVTEVWFTRFSVFNTRISARHLFWNCQWRCHVPPSVLCIPDPCFTWSITSSAVFIVTNVSLMCSPLIKINWYALRRCGALAENQEVTARWTRPQLFAWSMLLKLPFFSDTHPSLGPFYDRCFYLFSLGLLMERLYFIIRHLFVCTPFRFRLFWKVCFIYLVRQSLVEISIKYVYRT